MALIASQIDLSGLNISPMISLFKNYVTGAVFVHWDEALNGPIYWVYYGIIGSMLITLATAGFVAFKTVDAAIHLDIAFYHQFANYSSFTDNLFVYEVVCIAAFLLWSLLVTIMSIYTGSELWTLADARLAEAKAESIGVETPITMIKGMKAFVLMMVSAFAVMISGYSLGENAVEMISYFDHYYDKTTNEQTKKDDASYEAPKGEAA